MGAPGRGRAAAAPRRPEDAADSRGAGRGVCAAAEAVEASARLCEDAGFWLLSSGLRPATHGPQRVPACACAYTRARASPAGLSWPAWGAWPRPASTSCWETSSWSYTVTALLERGVRCPVHCSRPHARLTHDAACLPGPAPIRLTSPGTEPPKGAGGLT